MTTNPLTSASASAPDKPPSYWLGFVLNYFTFGGGFAFIGRPWLNILFLVIGHLTSGPFSRLVFGDAMKGWGLLLLPVLFVAMMVGYRNAYVKQFAPGQVPPKLGSMPMRLLGVWLTLLTFGVMQWGYAAGWLTL